MNTTVALVRDEELSPTHAAVLLGNFGYGARRGAATERLMIFGVFLSVLLTCHRQTVIELFICVANRKRNLPITPAELANALESMGVPRFAERLRVHLAE